MTTDLQTMTYFNVKTKVCFHDICVTTALTLHGPLSKYSMYGLESIELQAKGIRGTRPSV